MRSAISRRGVRGLVVLGLVAMAGCGGDSPGQPGDPGTLPLESFDAGFFSIDKPRGWDIVTAGSCTEFAFLAQDPAEARRQIFYFGSVGPIYLKAEQKAIDAAYVAAGGYDIPWRDAPVIDPLTPQNYLEHWPEIAAMPWVWMGHNCPFLDILNRKFSELGQQPEKRIDADHESILCALVLAGEGVTLMREDEALVGRERGQFAIWPGERLGLPLSFVCREARKVEPVLGAVRDVVASVWECAGCP